MRFPRATRLNANTAGELNTIVAHCMVHARRKFVEVAEDFPEECRFLLECLKMVYMNEAATQGMSPKKRLDLHKERSTPVMDRVWAWIRELTDGKQVEPNSGLGDAIEYMEKHWSLIHSAELNKVNPFECLVALQRYHVLVEENPEEWMPWNYVATLAGLGLTG